MTDFDRELDRSIELHLASGSPRRKELLRQIGVKFDVIKIDIEESRRELEPPVDFVKRMAREKACAGWSIVSDGLPALGADTIVLHKGTVMGKPQNESQAVQMLLSLSDSTHEVITAVCIAGEDQVEETFCVTEVAFRAITECEAKCYWGTGEPADKAGGYGIQGLGAVFVKDIKGSYSNVVGLPIMETTDLLRKFSVKWWQCVS